MSRYCAKPTCSEFANTWFELSREEQRVVRSDTSTKHAIGLCGSHADRFKVPAGWTLVTGNERAEPANQTHVGESETEVPWFLPAGAVVVENLPSVHGDSPTVSSKATGSQLDNTAEGSMLDRAFHGPKEREGSEGSTSESVVS